MSIVKLVVVLAVLAAVVGGAMFYFGMLKTDASGNVAVDTSGVSKLAADAQKAATEGYPAASAAFAQSKYEDTIRLYKDALQKDPNNPSSFEAKYRIGYSYEELGKTTEAMAAYKDYLASGDKDAERVAQASKKLGMLDGSGVK